MKYIILQEIDDEWTDKFVDKFNSIDWEITIYIDSPGGSVESKNIIRDIINKNSARVTLAWCVIYSVAFMLFHEAECAKYIFHDAVGMVHKPASSINYTGHGVGRWYYDQFMHNIMDWDQYDMSFLTDEERKIYDLWHDVYFTAARINEIMRL